MFEENSNLWYVYVYKNYLRRTINKYSVHIIYFFRLYLKRQSNISGDSRFSQLSGANANEIKHDHSPVEYVVTV